MYRALRRVSVCVKSIRRNTPEVDGSTFATYAEVTDKMVFLGTKRETKFEWRGHVDFKLPADGKPISVRLMSAQHVPGVGYQLLAVSQIIKRNSLAVAPTS